MSFDQYAFHQLYSVLHQRNVLGPILNVRCVSRDDEMLDSEVAWCLVDKSFLQTPGFGWLVIYQGLPFEARLAKSGLSDGLSPFCLKSESVKHILSECSFARSFWDLVHSQLGSIFQGHLHLRAVLSGNSRSVIWNSFVGIGNV